ncbi:MAG: hypothetical protein K2G37_06685 [Clostridia bacterium]|nr:hypothetical protein [Clostridia bacterium]MDE7329366.1 hypothetical protein [Clostridia bacterium]
MKRLSIKENVIKPCIIGSVVIVLGIVLLVYYRYFASSKSAASYVVSALMVAVGVALTASAIFRLVSVKRELQILTLGTPTTATFLSYDTEKSIGKVAVYYIEYKYEIDGQTFVCKSPSQFNWFEVLTLKVVGDFAIKTYKGKSVIDCDLMKMHLDNREAVAKLNAEYERALEELSK